MWPTDRRSFRRSLRRFLIGPLAGTAFVVGAIAPVVTADDPLSSSPTTDLQIRIAQTRVRLAEYTLERALAANRTVADAVGPREIDRLRRHVGLTQRQLAIAQTHPRTTANETNLAAAEVAVEESRADLEAALRSNRRQSGTVTEINVKRLQTKLELAELRVALLRNPTYVPSLIDEMQWHIDQLTDQLIELRHQIGTAANTDFGAAN